MTHERPPETSRRARIAAALAVVAAGLGALAAISIRRDDVRSDGRSDGRPPAVLTLVRNGFRYEYQVALGKEGLFEIKDGVCGVVDVLAQHAEEAKACRRELEKKIGVESLHELRAGSTDTVRRLHALGYF